MNNSTLAIDVDTIVFDGASRSSKWKSLRKYLKLTLAALESNAARISFLEKEIQLIAEENNKLTTITTILSDLANEEAQREISLTLNDTDFDIVIDKGPDPTESIPSINSKVSSNQTVNQPLSQEAIANLLNDLEKDLETLDKIGPKLAENIARHIFDTSENVARLYQQSIASHDNSVSQQLAQQQSLLDCEM